LKTPSGDHHPHIQGWAATTLNVSSHVRRAERAAYVDQPDDAHAEHADEHLDMLMVYLHLSPNVPEDVAFADSAV
jgi:urease alpha subunit